MNIEGHLIGWLNGRRLSAAACPHRPEHPPSRLVTVERTGGVSDGFIDRPMVAVQSWAPTRCEAEELAREVDRAIMEGLADGREVTSCTRSGLSYHPGEKGEPRYQAVYSMSAYEDDAPDGIGARA